MRYPRIVLVIAAALLCPGCVAAPLALTLLSVGAGVAAGTGTQYTLDGIAYRTFAEPSERVHQAMLASMRRMDVTVSTDEADEDGRTFEGTAGDRTVHIELVSLTTRTTRMRVTVKQGWFFRDRSTAGEIITQTEQALDDLPAIAQKPAAVPKGKKSTEAAK